MKTFWRRFCTEIIHQAVAGLGEELRVNFPPKRLWSPLNGAPLIYTRPDFEPIELQTDIKKYKNTPNQRFLNFLNRSPVGVGH